MPKRRALHAAFTFRPARATGALISIGVESKRRRISAFANFEPVERRDRDGSSVVVKGYELRGGKTLSRVLAGPYASC
jgi:hypothetical protein